MDDLRSIALHLFVGIDAKVPVLPAVTWRIQGGLEKPSSLVVPV